MSKAKSNSKANSNAEVMLSAPIMSLLQRAQERFIEQEGAQTGEPNPASTMSAGALAHELQVHQIELQMQNEELQRSQLALSESREDYFDLYDLAPVGYFTVTARGNIAKANLTLTSMLGCTRSTLLKKQVTRLIHESDQDRFYLCQKALSKASNAQTCELRIRKAGEGYFWGQAVLTLAKDRHGVAELRIILTDISARKQADEELTQLMRLLQERNTELEAAKVALELANRTQSTFISNVTHELRTPLNAILGFSQLLASGQPEPTASQQNRIDQISKAGWELLAMVDKIITLSEQK